MRPRRAVWLVFFLDGALMASWIARIPALAARVHAGDGLLGLALLAPALGAIVTFPRVGRLVVRFTSRTVSRVAALVLAVVIVLPALPTSVPLLCLVLLLVGSANSVLDVSMNANGMAVERTLGRPILSSLHAGFSFGGFAGAGLGAAAAAAGVSPLPDLLVSAGLFGGIGLVAGRGLLVADGDVDAAAPPLRLSRLPGRIVLLGVACLCSFVAEGGAADWSAKLVHDELAGTAALGALAYAAFSMAMAAGRLLGDRLFARWGSVATLRALCLLASVGFGVALAAGDAVGAVAGFAALGFGLSVVAPTLFRSATEEPGVATGSALGAVSAVGYTGFLAGPPIIGALASLTSLRLACALFVLAPALVFVLAFAARPPARLPSLQMVGT